MGMDMTIRFLPFVVAALWSVSASADSKRPSPEAYTIRS